MKHYDKKKEMAPKEDKSKGAKSGLKGPKGNAKGGDPKYYAC